VNREEYFQDFAVGNFLWIKGYLDDFGVTGSAGADLFIRGIVNRSARVSDDDIFDSSQVFIDWFQTPEAAAAQGGYLVIFRKLVIGSVHNSSITPYM
jgi:hypothetical protein